MHAFESLKVVGFCVFLAFHIHMGHKESEKKERRVEKEKKKVMVDNWIQESEDLIVRSYSV